MKMSSLKIFMLCAIALISASWLGYWWGRHAAPAPQLKNPTANAAQKKILYWFDPMVPDQHFDKPGKSPFMDMQLQAKYADAENTGTLNSGGIRIDAHTAQNFGVRLVRVERRPLNEGIDAVGSIEFNQRSVATVQARSDGYVTRVYARAPGDVVSAGAALADVSVPEWAAAQNEFLALRKAGANDLIDASRARLQALGMTSALIEKIEREGVAQPTVTITAPIAGVLQNLAVRMGMTIARGMTLAEINDVATVWLVASIPENQAAQVRVGDALTAQLTAQPETTITARVLAVLPQAEANSRTFTVRAELDNRAGRLHPGQFARVRTQRDSGAAVLSIPAEAIIRSGARTLVIRADAGHYQAIEVVSGREAQGRVEILKGLDEGQQIVASSQFLIDSEANLTAALQRLNGGVSSPAVETRP